MSFKRSQSRSDRQQQIPKVSDDNALTKQINDTHGHPDDVREFDVKPLLQMVEDVFDFKTNDVTQETVADSLDQNTKARYVFESLVDLIDKIGSEIDNKCREGAGGHEITMGTLKKLPNYSWGAKLVITLAAFAMNYGEFWVVKVKYYESDMLAKSIARLKQLTRVLDESSGQVDEMKRLIEVMINIAKCILKLKELPSLSTMTSIHRAEEKLPITVYWTIRSMVACSSLITGLMGMEDERISATETWELSSLTNKLSDMHKNLNAQLENCYKEIDKENQEKAFQELKTLTKTDQNDNMQILKALICGKDDPLPLFIKDKGRVKIDVLCNKNVLLLISDLDISEDDIFMLTNIQESRDLRKEQQEGHQYEIVWLPIIDWKDDMQDRFKKLQDGMTWYSICHPSLIDRGVIRFVREEWHFEKKPILVVLDPKGKVASFNAIHMMWIWGDLAFPFTTSREEELWSKESWGLKLLVNGLDPAVINWAAEEKYVCLYGGDDIEWIRKFTNTAKQVAKSAGIPLEMLYVGKSNPKKRVARNIETIIWENLSHLWEDKTYIWYFWVRIESMWRSKNQLGGKTKDDPIMKKIMKVLSFDSEAGWAIFAKGFDNQIVVEARGNIILSCLENYTKWKSDGTQQKEFIAAVKDAVEDAVKEQHHCNRLTFPPDDGKTSEIPCADCDNIMERFILYKCCD
ncbi:hypothetical protein JCGZ_10218 [Jatropha curcas]|uniref:Protein SIEVE ELEMENT OCCLUSION B-like n=1 Tax=Jatropha curcas TaxID=180498 RepID=A0A067LGB5_JATCU|nr:hypothetical protein JCGZ_10218 [Jatropha curcas]